MVVLGAVALAVMSPKEWPDIVLDGIRKKFGLGPGGSATEEAEEEEDPDE
jgi:hypothetical protein